MTACMTGHTCVRPIILVSNRLDEHSFYMLCGMGNCEHVGHLRLKKHERSSIYAHLPKEVKLLARQCAASGIRPGASACLIKNHSVSTSLPGSRPAYTVLQAGFVDCRQDCLQSKKGNIEWCWHHHWLLQRNQTNLQCSHTWEAHSQRTLWNVWWS